MLLKLCRSDVEDCPCMAGSIDMPWWAREQDPKKPLCANEWLSLLHNMSVPWLQASPESKKREIVSFLKPNITIGMVDHFQSYSKQGLPPQVRMLELIMQAFCRPPCSTAKGASK